MRSWAAMSDHSRPEHELDELADSIITAGFVLVQMTEGSLRQLAPELNLTDFRALSLLDQEGSMRLTDISALLDVTPTTATRLADRLGALGLVERVRHANDRRETHLVMAPPGRALVARVLRLRRQSVAELLRRTTPTERAAAARLLERVGHASGHEASA